MKAKIVKVKFIKEYDSQYGTMYLFAVEYEGKEALYSSKKKEQTKFVAGKDAEFNEESRTNKDGKKFLVIKPIYDKPGGNSNYGKQLKREQSKYSGFAMSYAKDLVVNDKVGIEAMLDKADEMFSWMVNRDKSIGV